MLETLLWILGVIVFLIVISISIALHEAGHMITAKKLGIPVPRFFVGFGPTVWSKKIKGTEYGIKAIPLGGFIQVEDVTQPEGSPERSLLSYVAPWKRILVFVAGPMVNIILGVVILFVLLLSVPVMITTTEVKSVNSCAKGENCFAEKAGFKSGDIITKIDGRPIYKYKDMDQGFSENGSVVEVKRGNQFITLKVKANNEKKIGVNIVQKEGYLNPPEATEAIYGLFQKSVHSLINIPKTIPKVFNAVIGKSERPEDSPSSVVGVGRIYGDVTATNKIDLDDKVKNLIQFSALLNLGLGIANLLPMLPLDGGRIFIAVLDSVKIRLDKIRKRQYTPTSYKWIAAMTAVMGTAVVSYMGLLIIADLIIPVKII